MNARILPHSCGKYSGAVKKIMPRGAAPVWSEECLLPG